MALKETLFNGPVPGGNGKRLYVGMYTKKEPAPAEPPALNLFVMYNQKEFYDYFIKIVLEKTTVGEEYRFDYLRALSTFEPANFHWWGGSLTEALKARGIVPTGKYTPSLIRSRKGAKTPVLLRIF
jgi:hypothetical protein